MSNGKECDHEWVEVEDLYAITRLDKKGENVTFLPSVGIPVVIEICKKCGEIKIFLAKSKGKI